MLRRLRAIMIYFQEFDSFEEMMEEIFRGAGVEGDHKIRDEQSQGEGDNRGSGRGNRR